MNIVVGSDPVPSYVLCALALWRSASLPPWSLTHPLPRWIYLGEVLSGPVVQAMQGGLKRIELKAEQYNICCVVCGDPQPQGREALPASSSLDEHPAVLHWHRVQAHAVTHQSVQGPAIWPVLPLFPPCARISNAQGSSGIVDNIPFAHGAAIQRASPLGPGRALTLPCGWNNAG